MEYIERETAIKIQCDDCGNYGFCDNDCYAVESIKRVHAADVRPVVRGEWSRIDYEPHGHDYKCSACGWKNDMPTHFCPNCGADMREENNG